MPFDPVLIAAVRVERARRADVEPSAGPHDLFTVATIAALLEGRFDGDLTMGELLTHGDLGVGTLNGLDGEMLVLDGVAWQGRVDGSLRRITPDERTPFACVVPFAADGAFAVAAPADGTLDLDALQDAIDARLPDPAGLWALRIEAEVACWTVRSIAKQSPPYRSLAEVAADERVTELPAGRATLVGFRAPDAFGGVGVAGYHLHGADAARAMGGHVLALALRSATVAYDRVDTVHVELPPGVDPALRALAPDAAARIRAAEHGVPGARG
ncbi:MAG: acetolactate decarboxylase [Chloroflexota bacterium]